MVEMTGWLPAIFDCEEPSFWKRGDGMIDDEKKICPKYGKSLVTRADQGAPAKCPYCGAKTEPAEDVNENWDTQDLQYLPSENVSLEEIESIWADSVSGIQDATVSIEPEQRETETPTNLSIKQKSLNWAPIPDESAADYELLKQIGEGGMGVVYSARQTSFDRDIALKMMKEDSAQSPAARARFLSEAAVTGDLDHPNIVPVHDLGSDDQDHLFYAMKNARGHRWEEALAANSKQENLDILLRLADAVAFAHSKGVVHRDLKPENVMLGEFGEVLLMDWGLAVSFSEMGKAEPVGSQTGPGGTPVYMAPEMAQADSEKIGPASDIYLLGAILYEILTERPPHTGNNVMHCLMNAAHNRIQPAETEGELLDVAKKAMATDILHRYETVQDFQNAIRECRAHHESLALSSRADDLLHQARETGEYDMFSRALLSFEEALNLWPENHHAREGTAETALEYAESAYKNRDLDLAEPLLDPEDDRHRGLLSKVGSARRERDARRKRLRFFKYGSATLVGVVLLVMTVAFFWIHSERNRAVRSEKNAVAARNREQKQRRKAENALRRAERENYYHSIALADQHIQNREFDKQKTLPK